MRPPAEAGKCYTPGKYNTHQLCAKWASVPFRTWIVILSRINEEERPIPVDSIFRTIHQRRSVRSYHPEPVPHKLLEQILEAGRWAPSGGNGQDWRFGAVTDPALRRELANAAGNQEFIAQAPVVIACCSAIWDPSTDSEFSLEVNRLRWGFDLGAYATASSESEGICTLVNNATPLIPGAHIQLAAAALGLGTCWIGYLDVQRASQLLHLPSGWKCYFLITLGYPAESNSSERIAMRDFAFTDLWENDWITGEQYLELGTVQIRPYRDSDEQDWLDSWGRVVVTSNAWILIWHSKPHYGKKSIELVAEMDGTIVGFIDVELEDEAGQLGLGKETPCGFVWEFGVLPQYQGLGIGRQLIEEAKKQLSNAGIRRLEFWSEDAEAQEFYAHYGMREIERHQQFFVQFPEDMRNKMHEDGFDLYFAYGYCALEKYPSVRDAYREVEDPKFPSGLTMGFELSW